MRIDDRICREARSQPLLGKACIEFHSGPKVKIKGLVHEDIKTRYSTLIMEGLWFSHTANWPLVLHSFIKQILMTYYATSKQDGMMLGD